MSSVFEGLPKTPNLSLNKPGYDNVADIEALNENADILDNEINTIKSNLKNKGSATEPIYFDDNGVPQKTKNFNDYLPLAGGQMTDTIIARSVNDSLLALIGGTNGDNGATLMLYGKDNSTGRFLIRANNGTAKKDFIGTADGGLTWDNKEIFHAGKVIPMANGGTGANNANDACTNLGALPTAGGNITGSLTVQNNDVDCIVAKSLNSNGYIKYSSGLTIQWGITRIITNSDTISHYVSVTPPISFTTFLQGFATYDYPQAGENDSLNAPKSYPTCAISGSNNKIYVGCQNVYGTSGSPRNIRWVAFTC